MKASEHIEAFAAASAVFIDCVADRDLDAPATGCPEWSVRELATHIGGIQRWGAHLVTHGITAETWRFELPLEYPDAGADHKAVALWLHKSAASATLAFEAADPTTPVWGWGSDQHARWWPRRMLHELLVHTVDLDDGIDTAAPELAGDAIEEFLENLPWIGRFGTDVRALTGNGETASIVATNADVAWRCKLEPQGMWWERTPASANVTVAGPALSVLLSLTGRARSDVEVTGDVMLYARTLGSLTF